MAYENSDVLFPHNFAVAVEDLLASTPENLQDDPIALYFRCRYNRREWLKNIVLTRPPFTERRRNKIPAELKRIERLRANFARQEQDRISSELGRIGRLRSVFLLRFNLPKEKQKFVSSELDRIDNLRSKLSPSDFHPHEQDKLWVALKDIDKQRSDLIRSSFHEKDWETVTLELYKINLLRAEIAESGQNENLLERMSRHRKEWIDDAKGSCTAKRQKFGGLLETAWYPKQKVWFEAALAAALDTSVPRNANQPPRKEDVAKCGGLRAIATERKERYEKELALALDPTAPRTPNQAPRQQDVEKYVGLLAAAKRKKKWYEQQLKVLRAFDNYNPAPLMPEILGIDNNYNVMVPRISMQRRTSLSPFTDYKIDNFPLQDALYAKDKETNPIVSRCGDNEIRYFHFPANNMLWVEEVIARYYGEKKGEYNYRHAANYCEKSSNLLCRANWTAMQHGSNADPVHARHMRSHCAHVLSKEEEEEEEEQTKPSGSGESQDSSLQSAASSTKTKTTRNFVLFMPFLHWETDKRRRKMAETMTKVTDEHRTIQRKRYPQLMRELEERLTDTVETFRIAYGGRAPTELTDRIPQMEPEEPPSKIEQLFSSLGLRPTSKPKKNPQPSRWIPESKLGRYLLDVAKVYDAMDIEPDLRLLIDHLHEKSPLHARRTLDQSYHSKLENTGRRDEDQVVYRGTKAGDSIDKTTRVVMVDQLWLYVLDDRTIISFFPRRWGRNKPDFSGVHRALRSRLDHPHAEEIQSVYDLALMIIDQCSTVFFDRSKPADARPQVLDIFSNAIAQVSEKKSIAFERFWRHLKKLNPKGSPQMDTEAIEIAARVYLDVNPEGELMRECHDIIDELRMMKHIYHQQQDVAKLFLKNLRDHSRTHRSKQSTRGQNWPRSTNMNGNANGTAHVTENSHQPIPNSTIGRAKDLELDIKSRLEELEALETSTQEITDHLNALLELKQQQASIIEAKAALSRADESVKQGRAIMMFTIVTIIFLPLSFMSSLFGMNAKELTNSEGGVMSIHKQFRFMFPISFGIIVVSLALAFSTWIRSAILFLASVIWAGCAEYSRLRKAWHWSVQGYDAKKLYHQDAKLTAKIYARKEREERKKAVEIAVGRENKRKDKEERRASTLEDVEMQRLSHSRRR